MLAWERYRLEKAAERLDGVPVTAATDLKVKTEALAHAREIERNGRTVLTKARLHVRELTEVGNQMWTSVKAVETEVDYAIARNTDPRDVIAHIQQNVVGSYKDLLAFGGSLSAASDRAA